MKEVYFFYFLCFDKVLQNFVVDERNCVCIQHLVSDTDFCQSVGVKWYLIVLWCIFLTMGKAEDLSEGLLGNQLSFYWNCLFTPIALLRGTGSWAFPDVVYNVALWIEILHCNIVKYTNSDFCGLGFLCLLQKDPSFYL